MEKPLRIFELCPEKLETLEDVRKILGLLKLRIRTDDPGFKDFEQYFTVEVVPLGYLKVLDLVGYEKINKMTLEEIGELGAKLLKESEESQNIE